MERACKNCKEMIYAGKDYCACCGSKWIDNRITLRQVAIDFSDIYLGLDTKFGRTFIDLFKQPEQVINGYIFGRRVNYMDAIRYLLLALFISGVYTFVLKNTNALDDLLQSQAATNIALYKEMGVPENQVLENVNRSERFTKAVLEFQGFFLILTIPVLALVARITFRGKRYYNFTEQIVFYMYTYGHSVIATTPFSILLVWLYPNLLVDIGFITFPLMFLYILYCYKRCFHLSYSRTLVKGLLAIAIGLGLAIALIILGVMLGILAGIILKATGQI